MKFETPMMVRELTPRILRVYMLVSLGAMNFGVDNNWWSACIGMQRFIDDYGVLKGPGEGYYLPSYWISVASGTPLAGWVLGCFISSEISTRFGRKPTLVVVCTLAIIGIVLQPSIPNYWGIMAGRLINSVSMGIEANCVPMYMSELAPATIRGTLVNFYQWWLMVGAVISSGIIYATSVHLHNQWAYKTVMVVQLIIPILLLIGLMFLPESPRWLLRKGRREQALKSLLFMRHGRATPEDVEVEFALLDAALQEQVETHYATSYLDCFKGTNGRRTLVALGLQSLQQVQGGAFVNTYLVIFLNQIGIHNSLQIQVANFGAQLGGATLAFYFTDKIGRRAMLLTGSFFMCVLLFIVSGLAAAHPNGVAGSTGQGVIAAILLYAVFNCGCWGACMWTCTAEVATNQLRERTISIATITGFCVSLLITYINPYVQNEPGNLGPRVGMVYASTSIIAFMFVWYFVPEMKRRSLEELDEMFEARVPAWKSATYVCTGKGARLTAMQIQLADASHTLSTDIAPHVIDGRYVEGDMPTTKTAEEVVTKTTSA
ncbi:hypothetical protein RBB50_000111 [Rhinocladiella similis]